MGRFGAVCRKTVLHGRENWERSRKMRLKTIAAAAGLAVVLSLGIGTTPGSADGILDSFANRATPATPGGSATGSSTNVDNAAAPITLGWHYGHAAFCG